MKFVSTKIPDVLSVLGIYNVFKHDLSKAKTIRTDIHDFPEMIYIVSGKRNMLIGGEKHTLHAGEAMIYSPNTSHAVENIEDSMAYIISFDVNSTVLHRLYNKPLLLNQTQKNMFTEFFDEAREGFVPHSLDDDVVGMVPRENVSEYFLEKIRKQFEFLLLELLKSSTDVQRKVKHKKTRIEEFVAIREFLIYNIEENLTLEDIANGCSMSVSKLKMLFREQNAGGVINYFINLKIREAKRRIREGKQNFTEIADSLGFNSLHYFSRLFKKVAGMSPSEYSKKQ